MISLQLLAQRRHDVPGMVGFTRVRKANSSSENETTAKSESLSVDVDVAQGLENQNQGVEWTGDSGMEWNGDCSPGHSAGEERNEDGGERGLEEEVDDEEGWITPENFQQACEAMGGALEVEPQGVVVGCVTTDFAMQVRSGSTCQELQSAK